MAAARRSGRALLPLIESVDDVRARTIAADARGQLDALAAASSTDSIKAWRYRKLRRPEGCIRSTKSRIEHGAEG
jgi:hypothetical protein